MPERGGYPRRRTKPHIMSLYVGPQQDLGPIYFVCRERACTRTHARTRASDIVWTANNIRKQHILTRTRVNTHIPVQLIIRSDGAVGFLCCVVWYACVFCVVVCVRERMSEVRVCAIECNAAFMNEPCVYPLNSIGIADRMPMCGLN